MFLQVCKDLGLLRRLQTAPKENAASLAQQGRALQPLGSRVGAPEATEGDENC